MKLNIKMEKENNEVNEYHYDNLIFEAKYLNWQRIELKNKKIFKELFINLKIIK